MEKIIFRKFLYDLTSFFIIVSFSLSLITWVIQSVNYLDFISQDGHGFKVYFSFIILNFPKIFSKLILFSFFVSLFYMIQKYQSNNEMLILWTNGISKFNFIKFIIKISIVFTIIQIASVYFLIPKSQSYSKDFIRNSNIDFFSSLITEKKFIDTVKDFTIFVESIDENGNMENIYLKDSINKLNTQIISAKSGKIIELGSTKYLSLKFGQILDISRGDEGETKVIKFNNTTFNISNFKTKSTTFPKLQELNSNILNSCIKHFFFGNKKDYSLTNFHCTKDSSLKSAKEIFNRSFKQIYIIALALITCMLVFLNDKNPKYSLQKIFVFLFGILCIILSELNSEFLNLSIINNIIILLLPLLIFILVLMVLININRKYS